MSEIMVNIRHARAAGMCVTGVQAWARRHGLDMRQICGTGYPASRIEQTDALGQRVVEQARKGAKQ